MPIDSGEIIVDGKRIGKDVDMPKDVGIIIEAPGFLPNYNGYNNLRLLSLGRGKIKKDRIISIIKQVGLDPHSKKWVSKYSLGMRQRLGIAVTLAGNPDFLVLDEPVNGLDPQGIIEMRELILKLNEFWGERGCIILQPYDIEKGAGTMNPATFLRALGPEPWNAAYVEPSRRPADGRYGDNPNRLQHYFQYQVILKPSPANVQELYLDSLKAIGIDPAEHDIRFVEDNWESPTLGAWGLGWEVWLDGMEVTQFTYFQQCGGIDCKDITDEDPYNRASRCPALIEATYVQAKTILIENGYDVESGIDSIESSIIQ